MRSLAWDRPSLIRRVRADIWRYLTPGAVFEDDILEAAALLKMQPREVRSLGAIQFLTCDEVGRLLDYVPLLLRRLASTTTHEEEVTADRIRGSIRWGRTIGLRYGSGAPNAYVTAPSRRAFQTPENQMLVLVLDAVVALGNEIGWSHSAAHEVGSLVARRVAAASRWQQSRMLLEVERRPVTPREVAQVRTGRSRLRYRPVLEAYSVYSRLVERLDRDAIRDAIEVQGLASREDSTIFEIYCTFEILRTLRSRGWGLARLGLFDGALRIEGRRALERIVVTYQSTPHLLRQESRYEKVQWIHGLARGVLRPDLVIWHTAGGPPRWLLIEIKGGTRRVDESARAAVRDLLAYRADFDRALSVQPAPYGVGIAWGAGLLPEPEGDILLCTPDAVSEVLEACGL